MIPFGFLIPAVDAGSPGVVLDDQLYSGGSNVVLDDQTRDYP